MDKKSTYVKTYELRQNDLCIMLKQLKPVSNKDCGKNLAQIEAICAYLYMLQNGYNEIIGENV